MDEVVTVRFTAQEVAVLNKMLDVALRAGGRDVVNGFTLIDSKLQQAVQSKIEQEKAEGE